MQVPRVLLQGVVGSPWASTPRLLVAAALRSSYSTQYEEAAHIANPSTTQTAESPPITPDSSTGSGDHVSDGRSSQTTSAYLAEEPLKQLVHKVTDSHVLMNFHPACLIHVVICGNAQAPPSEGRAHLSLHSSLQQSHTVGAAPSLVQERIQGCRAVSHYCQSPHSRISSSINSMCLVTTNAWGGRCVCCQCGPCKCSLWDAVHQHPDPTLPACML